MKSTAADLAVAVALISAYKNKPISNNSVFFGEVGLSRVVENVPNSKKRVSEAQKFGFKKIYCPNSSDLEEQDVLLVDHLSKLNII